MFQFYQELHRKLQKSSVSIPYCHLSFFQSLVTKEGSGAQPPSGRPSIPPPSVPPSIPFAEQRPRSSSPGGKPPDSSPSGPPLPPTSSHTESDAESLLEELQQRREQAGLAGKAQNTSSQSFSYKKVQLQSGFK